MISLTESAASKIKAMLTDRDDIGIRPAVQGGGCSGFTYKLEFVSTKDSKDREIENTYIVMEQYIDQDSVDAHGKSDHFRTASEKLAECLDGAPVIKRLDSIY